MTTCERCGEVNPAEIHTCTPQEPVAVWELQEGGWDTIADRDWMESLPIGTKLYTAPPQREWRGLTDEEKKEIYEKADAENWHDQPLLEAVEAKLKQKNA
jgi:hypothetical protein